MTYYTLPELNINFEDVFNLTGDCYCICDKNMKILGFNKNYALLQKKEPSELLGLDSFKLYPEFSKSVFFESLAHTIKTGQPNVAVGFSNNIEKHLIVRTLPYNDWYIFHVQELKSALHKSALTSIKDGLTSLYNKESFDEDLSSLLKNKINFSLILLDLNNFKSVNTEFGSDTGDLVLMETAARLKKSVNEKIYRLHSNLFAVMPISSKEGALQCCKTLLKSIKDPIEIKGKNYCITASAGVNHINNFEEPSAIIISNTENALIKAKQIKGSYFEHSFTFLKAKNNDLSFATEIREALAKKQFKPYYQGQIDILSKKIMGAESLIRWDHPEKGLLLPGAFLDVVRKHGLNLEIDKYVIESTFKDIVAWQKKWPMKISINLSAESICTMDIVHFISDQVDKYRVNPEYIAIEITEDALMTNLEVSKKVVQELKTMGFQIALDDFGTGYSSLGYLLKYPTDYLKIDKEFITGIDTSRTLQSVTSNIIKMGTSLGMLVIAEGIETKEEALVLKTLGCTIAQGFFFTKPVNKEQFEGFVERVGTSDLRSSLR